MKFITLSQKQIPTQYTIIRDSHILISINNYGEDFALPNIRTCKGILKLNFNDTEDITDKDVYFDMNMAKEILDFVDKHADAITLIVVHCGAGISRSTAVASALSKILNNSDDLIFSTKAPNMLVYTSLLEAYYMNKNYKSTWKKIFYLRDKSLKTSLDPVIYRIISYKVDKRDKE